MQRKSGLVTSKMQQKFGARFQVPLTLREIGQVDCNELLCGNRFEAVAARCDQNLPSDVLAEVATRPDDQTGRGNPA